MRKLTLLFSLIVAMAGYAYDFSAPSICEGFATILYYAVNPDGATVTVTFGPEKYSNPIVEIPSTVSDSGTNYTVTIIGSQSFLNSEVATLYMPNTITDIQESAFECSKISSLNFSNSLKRIGRNAFHQTPLVDVVLPEGLEEIADYAFENCENLQSLKLPSSISIIGDYAFFNNSIGEIDLPDSLQLLGEYVFGYCEKLKKVVLSKGLKRIKNDTFRECFSLTEVVFKEGLEVIEGGAFDHCPLTDFTLPISLRIIEGRNFTKINREDFTIPDNIESIGYELFCENRNLKKIIFGKGLKSLPAGVCQSCEFLTDITIPDNIIAIDNYAFSYCRSLSHIKIPDSIEEMPEHCFFDCTSLTDIVFPKYLKILGDYAFSGCTSLTNVEVPQYVENISNAFRDCSGITELTIPADVKYVRGHAFWEISGDIHMRGAIPPSQLWYHDQYADWPVNEGTATLFVPQGSKATYEEAPGWNCFKEIIEEDVPNPTFGMWGNVLSGYGSILLNGNELYAGTPVEIEYGKSATLTFQPTEGYMINLVEINGENISSQITDNKYTIEAVSSNYVIDAFFKPSPATVNLRLGNGGSMDIYQEIEKPFSCRIRADEGWEINSVYLRTPSFEGNITDDLTDDGSYTIPSLSGNIWISVSYEDLNNGVNELKMGADIRIYSTDAHSIVIEGAENASIAVSDLNGISVCNIRNASDHEIINVDHSGVYFIKVGTRSFKVAL